MTILWTCPRCRGKWPSPNHPCPALGQKPPEQDILDRMKDLLKQATTEKSHYYVASTLVAAMAEIERLREIEWQYQGLCD